MPDPATPRSNRKTRSRYAVDLRKYRHVLRAERRCGPQVAWLDADRQAKRVGAVHAVVNTMAGMLYLTSFVAKISGRRRVGVATSAAGGPMALVGGFLGGHLSFARGVGVDRTVQQRELVDWFPVEQATGDEIALQAASGQRYLVVEAGARDVAVPDRCTRCGGSLERADAGELVCGRDGSRFRPHDRRVVAGPATTPLPTFTVSDMNGVAGLCREQSR